MRLGGGGSARIPTCLSLLVATVVACGGGEGPSIEDVPDKLVGVGQELVIEIKATDPDGDDLDYGVSSDVPGLDAGALITRTAAQTGLFRWRPRAADVGVWHFDFTASDGDHTATLPVTIEVRSAIGDATTPVFRQPLGTGTTLDLGLRACLDLDIVIEDQDSVAVTLTQEEPVIEGATLDQTTGLAGTWRWCPSREQIDAEERYTLTLGADDGDNPKTIKNYLVVLRRRPQQNCPGAAPVISHTAMNASTLVDLTLDATITDDQGLKGPPLLYYATTPPAMPLNLGAMQQTTMLLISGDLRNGVWAADVPNPVASMPQGTSRTLYYVIVAGDDDDAVGSCDHETLAPATGAYQMTVTNPGGSGNLGVCESCSADVQCGDADDNCVMVGQSRHCLSSCAGPADCPSGYTCSTTALTSVDGAVARQCVPSSGSCAAGPTCTDDAYEDNDSRAQAQTRPPLAPGSIDVTSCPLADGSNDDEDWYRLEITADATVTLTLAGQEVSDLDLGLYDATGTRLASATGATSMETISHCLTPGTYYARVYAWGAGTENHYRLTYARTAGACATACVDDAHEPDDNAVQARVVTGTVYTSTANQICPGDDDWYEVLMFDGDPLTVDLTFTQASAAQDLDIHLYDEAGTDLTPCAPGMSSTCQLDNGQSADADEHFTFTAPAACASLCTYYVVVRGWGNASNAYDIRIEAP